MTGRPSIVRRSGCREGEEEGGKAGDVEAEEEARVGVRPTQLRQGEVGAKEEEVGAGVRAT